VHFLSILVATQLKFTCHLEGSKLIQALVLYFFSWEESIGNTWFTNEIAAVVCVFSPMLIIGISPAASWRPFAADYARGIFAKFIFFVPFCRVIAFNEGAFFVFRGSFRC